MTTRARVRKGRPVLYYPTAAEATANGEGPWPAVIVEVKTANIVDLIVFEPDADSGSGTLVTEADAVAAVEADALVAAEADAVAAVEADADGTYGAGTALLINELKANYNLAVDLINELKADYNLAVALINELKANYNGAADLANDNKDITNGLVAAGGGTRRNSVPQGVVPGSYALTGI